MPHLPMPGLRRCAAFTRQTFQRFSTSFDSSLLRYDVPGRQAGRRAIRWWRHQHALPRVQQADGHGRWSRPAGDRNGGRRVGVSQRAGGCRETRSAWQARRLLFLPRSAHVTGDIQIHEMAYVGDELWFVNTRFSCLATHDPDHSFAPVWRPKFISQLTPDDRCHLNGLGVVDGRPKWVTALGETDTAGGWRENKKSGGILIDIDSNEIVARGLSMPHSPRWHAGRLWLLESGTGSLGFVDLNTGKYESIVHLDGFTRGMEMVGNLAFIGLSQVRETAVFSGIQITERLQETERTCGVWVVDIQRGQVVAFLKFEEAVQEIFAVALLPGIRFPDLINDNTELVGSSFVLPDDALRDVPADLRAST